MWFVQQILKAAEAKDLKAVTSTLTIAECRRTGQKTPKPEIKRVINSILTSGRILLLSQITQGIAERARDLEWNDGINLKGADAIHVATAIITGCKELITFDGQASSSPLNNASKIAALGLSVIRPSQSKLLPHSYRQTEFDFEK